VSLIVDSPCVPDVAALVLVGSPLVPEDDEPQARVSTATNAACLDLTSLFYG
jgi:hypothetical protein